MKLHDSISNGNGQARHIIFCQQPHDSRSTNADGATAPAIFYQTPQGPQKEINNIKSEAVENQDEYSRRDKVTDDIKNCTRTQLREYYPGAYASWKNIKQRCRLGKGVLHPAFDQFPDFLQTLGPRPADGHSVDRISLDNPEYSPDNTRWAGKKLQTANRRNTRLLTDSQGTTRPASAWSDLYGVPARVIRQRLDREWSPDDAIKTPVGHRRPNSQSPGDSSRFPDHPPTYLKGMLDAWAEGIRQHHDTIFLLEFRHLKTAAYIYEGLSRCHVDPAKAVAHVLEHWDSFATHRLGSRTRDKLPELSVLKNYCMDISHSYTLDGGEILEWPDNGSKPWDGLDFDKEL